MCKICCKFTQNYARGPPLFGLFNALTNQIINGEKVEVVNGSNGKYLRTNPDNTKTDNLAHLIDFDWIAP